MLKSIEEINLNNQDLGDFFLKSFSKFSNKEKKRGGKKFWPKLKVFKIRNNPRISSVGLKYLYCTSIERQQLETIDVSY